MISTFKCSVAIEISHVDYVITVPLTANALWSCVSAIHTYWVDIIHTMLLSKTELLSLGKG